MSNMSESLRAYYLAVRQDNEYELHPKEDRQLNLVERAFIWTQRLDIDTPLALAGVGQLLPP